jgi:hypothetical protein
MSGFFAHGSALKIGLATVGGLSSIALPDQSRGDVNVTTHQSTGHARYVPGLRDGGTLTVEGVLLPTDAGQTALRSNYAGSAPATFTLTLPSDNDPLDPQPLATYVFAGFVSALGGGLPYDDKASFQATIRISGKVEVDPEEEA